MSQIVLLMTATIAPGNCPGAKFDVVTRLNQYLKAFKFYCKKLGGDEALSEKLVFCDNSGYDLSCFREMIPEGLESQVELLSLNPIEFTPEYGKGYNEALLIDLAMRKSEFVKGCDENVLVVKVTGRYSILNISHFMRFFRKRNPQLHVDIKDHRLYSTLGFKWNEHYSDTRLVAFTKRFYQAHLAGRYSEVCDTRGFTLEQFYYNVYLAFKNDHELSFRSRQDLFIDGLNGHTPRFCSIVIPLKFQQPIGYLKSLIRTSLRYLFPFFWC